MLKFIENVPKENRKLKLGTYDIDMPLVDDVEETIASLTRATAWQIITGQGIYWGWEVEYSYENEIQHVRHRKHPKKKTRIRKARIVKVKQWKPKAGPHYQYKFQFRGNENKKPPKKKLPSEKLTAFRQLTKILRKSGMDIQAARMKANELLFATMAE